MPSIRLRPDQIDRLRQSRNASEVIRRAVFRFRKGDFVIGMKQKHGKTKNILQVFPIWHKPDNLSDWQIREILDQHWNTPDIAFHKKIEQEISRLDKEIAGMFKLLPKYIIEEGENK